MGEIADALRRAVPLDPQPTRQEHRDEIDRDPGHALRRPIPDPPLAPQPPVETREHPIERPILRLMGVGNDQSQPARICLDDPQGHSAQQYRRLAIRLRGLAAPRKARSIVITSARAGDGKTTTACNLAIALAMTDHDSRVVLVDLDLHRASIAPSLGVRIDTPVDAVLRGEATLEQAVMETDVEGFFLAGANVRAKSPEQLLARPEFAGMIANLASRFDWVIIDTPPVLATSDAQLILQHAAAALLVVRAGVSPVRAVRKALDHLPPRKVLASFLNSSEPKNQQHDYYDDYYQSSGSHDAAIPTDPDDLGDLGDVDAERN